MKSVKFDGKVVQVKKTETIKEDTDVEEQVITISTQDSETITLKGPAGFLDDIIVDDADGEVKTKLDVQVSLKRTQQTLNEASK